jgi:hypothetical protein
MVQSDNVNPINFTPNDVKPKDWTWTPLPQTFVSFVPSPGVCPGCGRCQYCGRPYPTVIPQPYIGDWPIGVGGATWGGTGLQPNLQVGMTENK